MGMMIELIIIMVFLFLVAQIYFRLADHYNIIDKPNERSSHTQTTLRGGGILFPIAWLSFFVVSGGLFPWFTLGLVVVSVVSFWDDVTPLSNKTRLLAHIIGFMLSLYELGLWQAYSLWVVLLLTVGCIAALNIFNFMDGINGMTGLYALSILLPFLWCSGGLATISISNPWLVIVLSVMVFGFFNFRKKARCFAGDVGSVSMGYILIFLVVGLIFGRWMPGGMNLSTDAASKPFDIKYILLFAVYGIDGVLTIIQRLYHQENIFKAHRKHLYQLLVNERVWSHLVVAGVCCFFLILVYFCIFFFLLFRSFF